ncbi:helix-turn-helix transcriptional regulator [Sporosarcina sp. P7]|uniref:helix-turn-helix transcriptional regulator n=1 Tax=Sporosarcina sp. P7 TaxID=2048244 RepID=UPI000C16C18F|nr:helix-turn-helix transcriptional regulator [Sporosarcina sp. P7]PID24870.1 transcriptional regulator [Sporosarcina sp. P7]
MRMWLKAEREMKKLTYQSIADLIDVERQYYGMIEKGNRTPSPKVAKKIAKVLGVDWTLFLRCEATKRFLLERIIIFKIFTKHVYKSVPI